MKYRSVRIIALTIVSAFAVFLAIPNELFIYGNWILSLFCLTPLFIGVILAPDKGLAGCMGLIFGVLTTVLSYYWLAFFQDFSVWTITGTSLGYALYFLIFFPFLKRFSSVSPTFRPIIIAAAWTVFEYFKTAGYLGFPWGLMAYPLTPLLPLVQIADITGVWGISFLSVLFQAVLAETVLVLFHLRVEPAVLPRRLAKRGGKVSYRKLISSPVRPIARDFTFPRLYLFERRRIRSSGRTSRAKVWRLAPSRRSSSR